MSTVRVTPEEKQRFTELVKRLGFNNLSHFFRHIVTTLIEQVSSGHDLVWPLRFEQRTKNSANKKR
jgi:hypothetical protein